MPKNTLNLAIVGAGYWGANLVKAFYLNPRVNITAVCDINARHREAIVKNYPALKTAQTLDEVLANPEVEAVVIGTPTETHYALTRECLKQAKHVLVEKPLASNSAQCRELTAMAQQAGKILMVGHIFLYNRAIQFIHNLIQKGELGKIIYISCQRLNLGPVRYDVDALWDLAPHDISICNYWLGAEPDRGVATGVNHLSKTRCDVVFATLHYPNQVLVNLSLSWLDPKKTRQIVVVGNKKMVVFDDLDPLGAVRIYENTVNESNDTAPHPVDSIQTFKNPLHGGNLTVPRIALAEPLAEECKCFVDSVLDGKPVLSDGHVGYSVVKVLELLSQSLERRQEIGVEELTTARVKLA